MSGWRKSVLALAGYLGQTPLKQFEFGRFGRASLAQPVEIDHPELVYIEDDVLVGPYLQVKIDPLTGSLRMHRRAYLGRFGTIYARFPVVFGEAVMAGDQLCIGVDPPPDRNPGPVSIGAGTFVGVASVICSGVTIGAGSYVGAGSIVMNDMPPGYLIAGNPARPIKPLHG